MNILLQNFTTLWRWKYPKINTQSSHYQTTLEQDPHDNNAVNLRRQYIQICKINCYAFSKWRISLFMFILYQNPQIFNILNYCQHTSLCKNVKYGTRSDKQNQNSDDQDRQDQYKPIINTCIRHSKLLILLLNYPCHLWSEWVIVV